MTFHFDEPLVAAIVARKETIDSTLTISMFDLGEHVWLIHTVSDRDIDKYTLHKEDELMSRLENMLLLGYEIRSAPGYRVKASVEVIKKGL